MSIKQAKKEYLDKCLENSLVFGTDGTYSYLKFKKEKNKYIITGVVESVLPDDVYIDGIFSGIGKGAFMGTKIKSVVCGYGVRFIADSAFENCRELQSFKTTDTIRTIGKSSFKGCIKLEQFECGSKIYMVDHDAFQDCEALKVINFGRGLSYLGAGVFSGCKSLTRVQLRYTYIYRLRKEVFKGCISLKRIELPDTCTYIEDEGFCDCCNLRFIEVGCALNYLGIAAFYGCNSLEVVQIRDMEMGNSGWSLLISGKNEAFSELPWLCVTKDGIRWLMERVRE